MVNLVKLYGNKVELPYHRLAYPITPPPPKIQAGLESYDALRLDLALQSLPTSQRKQTVQFLRRLGRALHDLWRRHQAQWPHLHPLRSRLHAA